MAQKRGASISLKLILTSIALVSAIVTFSSLSSTLNTRRYFDEAAQRLADAHTTALQQRGRVQTLTLVETARNALMQNDYSMLKDFVPAAAKNDPDVLAIYVVADTGIVAAHSDSRLSEKPIAEVDPILGPRLSGVTQPLTEIVDVAPAGKAPDKRFVFASPLLALGKKQGTLVVVYSLKSLESDLARIELEKKQSSQAHMFRAALLGLIFVILGAVVAIIQGLRITRPIKLLAFRADQIARGDLGTRVEVSSPDEIGLLANNFNDMADRLQVLLQETAAKATLEKELEVARAIQETLVPPADQLRLRAYSDRLVEILRDATPGTMVSMASLLPPVFELARQRSATPEADPARENRAALLALAFYANQRGLAAIVPAARHWPQPPALTVTLSGRIDTPLHWLISAAVAAESGTPLADAIGLYKEVSDSRGGSGFSFNDLAADRAGTRLGERAVRDPRGVQERIARGVMESDLLPDLTDLPESLGAETFARRYGDLEAPRFMSTMREIESRLDTLPLLR